MPASKFQDFDGVTILVCACGCRQWYIDENDEPVCVKCNECRQYEDEGTE